MKLTLASILIFIASYTACLAQQNRKTDDGLLLEYYQNNRFVEALNYLKTIYTEPITDVKELSRMAYIASKASKLPEAEVFYQRMYDLDTTDKSSLQNMANINMLRGNGFKAEVFLKKYLKIDSTNFDVYKDLANLSRRKGDVAAQLIYLQKANKLDSAEFDVASDLSNRYVDLKMLPLAEKVLMPALAADPENLILLRSLLTLTTEQKKWDIAIKTGEQLLQAGDNSVFVVNKLGKAYYYAKNYRCGLETLLGLPPSLQSEATAYFTALCFKRLNDQKNAIVYLEKAVELSISPSTSAYYGEMADSYETRDQLTKALSSYQKALLYDDYHLTYYYLANLYDVKLKDPKNALKYFKKYVASNPDMEKEKEYVAYSKARIDNLQPKRKR